MVEVLQAIVNVLDIKYVVLAACVFVPLQRVLPMHANQSQLRQGLKNDLVYMFVNGIPIGLGIVLIVAVTTSVREIFDLRSVGEFVAEQPIWTQFVEIVLISDFCFYWMHRLFHSIPLLWKFHAIHHSIEEMDWVAGYRVHPIDQILTKGISLIPCFAFEFSDWIIAAAAVFYRWHSILLHSNVRLPLGPLRWFFASPEVHHWHHSNQLEAHNKNFGAQLLLWDFVFGTAYMPEGIVPSVYGIDEQVPQTYLKQLLYPFRSVRRGRCRNSMLGKVESDFDV